MEDNSGLVVGFIYIGCSANVLSQGETVSLTFVRIMSCYEP